MQKVLTRHLEAWMTTIEEDLDDNGDDLGDVWVKAVQHNLDAMQSLIEDVPRLFTALELAHGLIIDMDDRGELDEDDETSEAGREVLAIVSILNSRTIYEEVS